jgi:hypothetical protein
LGAAALAATALCGSLVPLFWSTGSILRYS